jgi:Holliday junction resolvase RusA-like endonuclease
MARFREGLFLHVFVLLVSFIVANCWTVYPNEATVWKQRQRSAMSYRSSLSRLRGSLWAVKDENAERSAPKKAKRKKSTEPAYWLNETDTVQLEVNEGDLSLFRFKIRGNPRPLVRHRTGRGFMYNPSAGLQESFRNEVLKIISAHKQLEAPLFREEDCLVMSVVLRMKRPKSHFINNKPGPDRLKATAPPITAPTRTDVDNLIKFIMDSMNNILYPDDRQIVSLHVTKLLDDELLCQGSTEICLRTMHASDFEILMDNSFRILEP